MLNGYGICKSLDWAMYHGEFEDSCSEGYGLMKYANKDEYYGQWKRFARHGEGVFKEGSTGRVERRLYAQNKVIEILEVIQEGQ